MDIERCGQKITLTPVELRDAYWEAEELCTVQDLEDMLEELVEQGELPSGLSEEDRTSVIKKALPILRKYYDDNELRGDLYWNARIDALQEACKMICVHGKNRGDKGDRLRACRDVALHVRNVQNAQSTKNAQGGTIGTPRPSFKGFVIGYF